MTSSRQTRRRQTTGTQTRTPGVAVVTGGTAGIGRATVRELARRGWDVAALARGQERLDDTVREVRETGRRGIGLSVDVADHAAVEAAADEVEDAPGPIDLWVDDAFTGAIAFFDEITPEEFERMTSVTHLGYVNGTRAALRRMAPRNRGTIIQVGSALAHRGIPLQAPYCGAKHAVKGFTESLRVEVMHKGLDVDICQVDMPAMNTPQFDWVLHRGIDHHPMPVAPIYQPEVAARAVAHVAEHPRRTMWVGLPTVLTILGNRVAPALLDHLLARTNVKGQQSPTTTPLRPARTSGNRRTAPRCRPTAASRQGVCAQPGSLGQHAPGSARPRCRRRSRRGVRPARADPVVTRPAVETAACPGAADG